MTQARRAVLSIRAPDGSANSYDVATLRRGRENGGVDSLFVLLAPEGLRGTAFLLREEPDSPPNVWLHLPGSKPEVLPLAASEIDDFFLGSESTYADWRVAWPIDALGLVVVDANPATAVLDLLPRQPEPGLNWHRARVEVDLRRALIVRADYYRRPNDRLPERTFEAGGFIDIDGAAVPGWMRFTRRGWRGYVTSVELRGAWHGRSLSASLFRPEALPEAVRRVQPLLPPDFEPLPVHDSRGASRPGR